MFILCSCLNHLYNKGRLPQAASTCERQKITPSPALPRFISFPYCIILFCFQNSVTYCTTNVI